MAKAKVTHFAAQEQKDGGGYEWFLTDAMGRTRSGGERDYARLFTARHGARRKLGLSAVLVPYGGRK